MKPLRLLLLTCLLSLAPALRAGGDPPVSGARPMALGNAFTALRGDYYALFHNPAAITGVEQLSAGFSYERRLLLSELSYAGAGAVAPFKGNQALGLALSTSGFEGFRENRIGLSYGITVLDLISIGLAANYFSIAIPNYGNSGGLLLDIGLHTELSPSVSLGASARNVNRSSIPTLNGEQDLPTVISAGLHYHPTDKVRVLADVQKDIDHPLSFRGGIEYLPASQLALRAGVSINPLTLSGGIGYTWKLLSIDFASAYTEFLGYTPQLSLVARFGK